MPCHVLSCIGALRGTVRLPRSFFLTMHNFQRKMTPKMRKCEHGMDYLYLIFWWIWWFKRSMILINVIIMACTYIYQNSYFDNVSHEIQIYYPSVKRSDVNSEDHIVHIAERWKHSKSRDIFPTSLRRSKTLDAQQKWNSDFNLSGNWKWAWAE